MIHIESLHFGYKKNKELFRDLFYKSDTGSISGLFGKNGAGKTTLFKLITGALYPWEGRVSVNGIPSASRTPEVLSDIFIIPEEFNLPRLSVSKYVDLHAPFFSKFDHTFFLHALHEFDLNEELNLHEMSYGQKKKVLISFGLSTQTGILLLDEPTNGLDIPSKSQFRKIIAAADTKDRTIIISTHQVRDLASVIDRISVIDNGQIIFDHSIPDIAGHLAFETIQNGHDNERILYSEEGFGNKRAICTRLNKETDIDLELLFNAVIQNTEIINKQFKNE